MEYDIGIVRHQRIIPFGGSGFVVPAPTRELREDGWVELREDGTVELRE